MYKTDAFRCGVDEAGCDPKARSDDATTMNAGSLQGTRLTSELEEKAVCRCIETMPPTATTRRKS